MYLDFCLNVQYDTICLSKKNGFYMKVNKAIFPVAGLGTRFLPATKANPKEMLPIVDKPLIQYAVEEAIAAGITKLIFVTNSSKRAIEDHFDSDIGLEMTLMERGKKDLLDIVKGILPEGISCVYIRQKSPQGLGHAVLCAQALIVNEPFAVILADDLIDGGDKPCLKQMVEEFAILKSNIIAVEQIPKHKVNQYGIVNVKSIQQQISQICGIIEKPQLENAPSNLGVVGRYIFTPNLFRFLQKTQMGSGGEIQLTDAIAELLHEEPVYAYRFNGKRYDCGNKLGYLKATIEYALKHSELATHFKQYLQAIVNEEKICN